MSTPTFSYCRVGVSCGMRVSFCCDLSYASQFSTTCLMSAAMLGQYRHSRALRRTLSTPRCNLWSFRILSGTTTRSQRNISPSFTASSSFMLKYAWTLVGTSLLVSGQPRVFQHLQCLILVYESLKHFHAFADRLIFHNVHGTEVIVPSEQWKVQP